MEISRFLVSKSVRRLMEFFYVSHVVKVQFFFFKWVLAREGMRDSNRGWLCCYPLGFGPI